MTNQTRVRQLADRVRTLTAELLERRVKDPRLGFVTVTDARLTSDLSQATVFYTVFGDADSVDETQRALASATGMIRSELGRRLGLRHTPSLAFVQDALPTTSASVEEALLRAAAADAEVARLAEGATYAGDPDPYRHDDPDDDDVEADDEDDELGDPSPLQR
jgi:ribosome-binding factor A